jgi:hypothetical protein
MKISIEQIKADQAFMEFWNMVYGADFASLKNDVKEAFMQVAYFGFIAGMQHQRLSVKIK